MRSLLTLALLLPLVGCAKKPKVTGKAEDTASAVPALPQPAVKPKAGEKVEKAEKKNWVGDPRYAKKADAAAPEPPKDGQPNGKTPWVGQAPPDATAQTPVPPAQPGGGKPDAGKPQPPAGASRVTKEDLENVWTFVDTLSLAGGKMPPPNLTYAALVGAKSPAAALVKDGSIILTGAAGRESVWAFERSAPTQGGMIVTQNKVEVVTAAEFARRVTGR